MANVIALKIDFNGTVQDYVSFAKYSSNSGRYGLCNHDRFQVANGSSLQLKVGAYCDVFDSSGNAVSTGNTYRHVGFDSNLSFIRSIPYSPCSGMNIFEAIILLEKRITLLRVEDIAAAQIFVVSIYPLLQLVDIISTELIRLFQCLRMGTIDWSYSWTDNSNQLDNYGIIALSYGIIWTGPKISL